MASPTAPGPRAPIRHLLLMHASARTKLAASGRRGVEVAQRLKETEALRRRWQRALARDLQQAARRSPQQWSRHGILHSLPALYGPRLPGGDDTSLQRLVAWPSALARPGVITSDQRQDVSQRHQPIRRRRLAGPQAAKRTRPWSRAELTLRLLSLAPPTSVLVPMRNDGPSASVEERWRAILSQQGAYWLVPGQARNRTVLNGSPTSRSQGQSH